MDMVVEDEVESRKKLDEQSGKLQKELREIEKFSCLSKEVQESLKSNLQQQLQEVEQRRHDLMPEHQKVQKISQKIQNIQDKRRNSQKDSTAAEEEMRKIREEIDCKERFRHLSDKVDKYRMVDAEMAAELQGLQAGKERKGSNASQAVDCCMETMVEQFFAMGADYEVQVGCCKKLEVYTPSAQMLGKGGGRINSEDEQEQGKASQQLALTVRRVE